MAEKQTKETTPKKNAGAQMKHRKLQWHPAFGAALEMEFIKEKDRLSIKREHLLNMKPLQVDCLVVKKVKGAVLENEIGKFFKEHNIIEYKSVRAALSIDTVSKVQAYAYLYKAYGGSVDRIKFDEITATLIRESRPEALFKYLDENGYRVSNPYSGIYYIESGFHIPTQIIVGSELDSGAHEWLHLLSGRVTKQEMAHAIAYSRNTESQEERSLIDAIFEVSVAANKEVVEELLRGDETMCQALMEIMKPEIDEIVNTAVLQERKKTAERVEKETAERVEKETAERVEKETAERVEKETAERVEKETAERTIKATVKSLRRFNASDADIKAALVEDYGLSEQEALSYLQ